MNRDLMEQGIRLFLSGLFAGDGDRSPDPLTAELLAQTPRRVTEAFGADLLAGYAHDPASVIVPAALGTATGPVVLRGIGFASICAHHLLPYRGDAHLGFVPRGQHTGIGNLARLVDLLSRRLTLQEPLTAAIADQLMTALAPRSVLVVLQTQHECLAMRGARKEAHRLLTLERRGEPDADLERMVLGGESTG